MRLTTAGFLLLLYAASPARAATVVVTNLTDSSGSCPSASSCTLRAAIAAANPGDTVAFDPLLPLPATIVLTGSELTINKNLTVTGPGAALLQIDAPAARRVLSITAGDVVVSALTLASGESLGQNGQSAGGGTGGNGQTGQPGEGGCARIAAGASVVFDHVSLTNCAANGGDGGNGGSGSTGGTVAADRIGGSGGRGGHGLGGALAVFGSVTLLNSSIDQCSAASGRGGRGGNGGVPMFGSGGNGGTGGESGDALGGAIHVASGGSLLVRNSTISALGVDAAVGGTGGDGGAAGSGGSGGDGGDGGVSGDARGGQVHVAAGALLADFEFTTLRGASVAASAGGAPGNGTGTGEDGLPGEGGAEAGEVLAAPANARTRSSVFGGTAALGDCALTPTVSGANFGSDASCGATLVGAFATHFAAIPLEEDGRIVWPPQPGANVIDAATDCNDLAGQPVLDDQSDRIRPLDGDAVVGAACDVGAVEFTFLLFRDGFEGN